MDNCDYMMESYYGNDKIKSDMDNVICCGTHGDAWAEPIIPHCMFKSILFLCLFGEFCCAKTHIILVQKALPPKLKEPGHILLLILG